MCVTEFASRLCVGSVSAQPDNWRRMIFARPLSAFELCMCNGASVWNFQWEKGSFEVEFHADGFNHFICHKYPAHAHWSMTSDGKITINWGSYGEYELILDAEKMAMTGHKKGQPMNWRKAQLVRFFSPQEFAASLRTPHDHSHDHSHNGGSCSCGHEH